MLSVIDILFMLFSFVNIYFFVLFFILFVFERKNINRLPRLKDLPSVSVIIPAYNKEEFIAETVKAAKNLAYPKRLLEVIAVDDGSTDGTYGILKRIKGIRLFTKPNGGGRAGAVNYGIEKAKGEIVACVDADSYPEKESLIKAIQFFEDEKVAGVTVSILVKNSNNFMQRLQKIEYALLVLGRKLMERLNCIYVTPGPFCLYRRDIIRKLGGFDRENMTEDIEIAWRLLRNGYKIKMSVDSKVYTDVPDAMGKWWQQRLRWNIGGFQTAMKYSGFFFRSPSNIGMFLLPLFTLSYALALLGLIMFSYIVLAAAYNFAFVYVGSVLMGARMFNLSFLIVPDILTIVGIFTFAVSMLWLRVSLNAIKDEISIRKNLLEFAAFVLFYVAIHPFNLIAATWKLLKKDYKW